MMIKGSDPILGLYLKLVVYGLQGCATNAVHSIDWVKMKLIRIPGYNIFRTIAQTRSGLPEASKYSTTVAKASRHRGKVPVQRIVIQLSINHRSRLRPWVNSGISVLLIPGRITRIAWRTMTRATGKCPASCRRCSFTVTRALKITEVSERIE